LCSLDVYAQGCDRVRPGRRNVGLGSQVIDDIDLTLRQTLRDVIAVREVGPTGRAGEGNDLVSR